jgi:alkyl sulfatase BDS1-like metallo-beta-lactamase superfamily hydrolase
MVPLKNIFDIMQIKIDPARTAGINESFQFLFPDVKEKFIVTLRNGIVEVVNGEPLPFTPEPAAKIFVDSRDFKLMSMGLEKPMDLYSTGRLKIKNDMQKLTEFLGMIKK